LAALNIGAISQGERRKWGLTLGIAVIPLLILLVSANEPDMGRRLVLGAVALGTLVFAAIRWKVFAMVLAAVLLLLPAMTDNATLTARSFFGVYRVTTTTSGFHQLVHGTTVHGIQNMAEGRRGEPLSYYSKAGPLGDALNTIQAARPSLRIAAVGLGTGSIASYTRPGDTLTFYEIDPLMVRIARNPDYFTYLNDASGSVEVEVGDGRLRLAEVPNATFDVIILDAFSSDAVPAHLLSTEAFQMYRSKLAPNGTLLANISNKYLDLESVAEGGLRSAGMQASTRLDNGPKERGQGGLASQWVAASAEASQLDGIRRIAGWRDLRNRSGITWTDDYSNIVRILK
jgi:hypothetical protein